MYVCMYVCMYACMYVCACLCTYNRDLFDIRAEQGCCEHKRLSTGFQVSIPSYVYVYNLAIEGFGWPSEV